MGRPIYLRISHYGGFAAGWRFPQSVKFRTTARISALWKSPVRLCKGRARALVSYLRRFVFFAILWRNGGRVGGSRIRVLVTKSRLWRAPISPTQIPNEGKGRQGWRRQAAIHVFATPTRHRSRSGPEGALAPRRKLLFLPLHRSR